MTEYGGLNMACYNDSAGKLPEGRFAGLRPPRNVSLLLLFASFAGKKKQQKGCFRGPAAPLASKPAVSYNSALTFTVNTKVWYALTCCIRHRPRDRRLACDT